MGSSNILGKKRIEKIQKLSSQGYSIPEISGALHISKKIIKDIVGGKNEHIKNSKPRKKNNENVKRGRPRNTKLHKYESGGGSDNIPVESNAPNESGSKQIGSRGYESNGINDKIVFIGGKKDMPKNKEKKDEAEGEADNSKADKYQCGNCGAFFSEELDVCPSCGAELDIEAYD